MQPLQPAPKRPVRVLTPQVAERIAAGEVIERPASVVKELVENSLDAGATEVAVILEDGGKSLIEIIDNGHGMTRDDLSLCIQRHATSKLTSLEDLEKILTLGFRGEALPSVAAVAELSLLSRAQDEETAYELGPQAIGVPNSQPEPVTFGHFLHSAHGTRIRARSLFSQVPARLKFLKSQAAEVSQVREWLERLAVAHPAVGFRLVSDDRTVLNLRPADEKTRVQAILSDGEDYPVISAESHDVGIRVRFHWLQGLSTPQTRRMVQIVNGRAVRDRMLQQALLSPFRQALLPGQFPAVALFVEIDPSQLDVNVHPTKTEVRFLNNRTVFHAVESMIEGAISRHGAPAYVPQATSSGFGFARPTLSTPSADSAPWAPALANTPLFQAASPTPQSSSLQSKMEFTNPESAHHPLSTGRFAGILFHTYLLYDLGQELVLVDQHAADERIRYERLKHRIFKKAETGAAPSTQSLLIPEAVRFPVESRPDVELRLPLLLALGFEAEIFGDDTVLFRGIPAEWESTELRTRLKNLLDRLISLEQLPKTPQAQAQVQPHVQNDSSALLLDESLFETLASEACHSAVRAGDPLEREEAEALVHDLFRCEHPWNCPHGRPTVVRIPRGRLEEWFQRRV